VRRSNAVLPDFRYGGAFSKHPFHSFRPSSVFEWIAYLYERNEYELLARSNRKRPLGEGDLFLQKIATKDFKDLEVKGPKDCLHLSQVLSLATTPSSQERQREVMWFQTEKENDGEIDPVPCPLNADHVAGRHICMDEIHRPLPFEVNEIDSIRAKGAPNRLHAQDCTGLPVLTVKVPKAAMLEPVYEDFAASFPKCCYRLFASWKDQEKGALKLQVDRDSAR
jgi:hypothetical protein